MQIKYLTVQPTGAGGTYEAHVLPKGWEHHTHDEWAQAIHYGAGLIEVTDKGVERRIPIEFGFGYVLQYIRQFIEAERAQDGRVRSRLQQQLDWIGTGLPIRLRRKADQIEVVADRTHTFGREAFIGALSASEQ